MCPEVPAPEVNSSVHASLLKISEALGSNLELASVLQTILDLTLQQMQAQQGSILLFDEHQDRLQMLASTGLPTEIVRKGEYHSLDLNAECLAAIGQTVAGISHCIKNMLTDVRGGMSLIEIASNSRSWERLDKGHSILNRNIERIASVILDMLDYSKERQPRKGCVSLISLVEEVIGSVESEAEMHQVKLEQRLDPDAKMVEVDAQQIFRCLLNLIHNAIEATPKGGTVWVGSEQKSNQATLNRLRDPSAKGAVIIRVGDTGPGIGAEDCKNLFEPFFSTKGSKGTGLGLAVTRKIVEEHGGRIEVDSEPGEPAVFAIHLPA